MGYFRRVNLLDRKKRNPYKFSFTGLNTSQQTDIQLFEYSHEFITEKKGISLPEIGDINTTDCISWVNIHGLSNTELIVDLCKTYKIDNLVIQDILDLNQRPKFQEFDDYCFLTIKTTVPSTSQMEIEQISFVFSDQFLISFQEKKADYFEHIRFRIRENQGVIRERGADFLLYTMLESTLDNYFKTLDKINNDIESLNLLNFNSDPSPVLLENIEKHKIFVHFIKNAINPIKEFVLTNERDTNKFIEKRSLKYFSEIKDLCFTLIDNCNTISTLLESSTNLFFSVQSHKMNQVMKTLTIVSTIFIPLTFIAGIYGMNFKYMPELEWKYGYLVVWITNFILLIAMIIYFKRKKWF
jgi:magnesium transporter